MCISYCMCVCVCVCVSNVLSFTSKNSDRKGKKGVQAKKANPWFQSRSFVYNILCTILNATSCHLHIQHTRFKSNYWQRWWWWWWSLSAHRYFSVLWNMLQPSELNWYLRRKIEYFLPFRTRFGRASCCNRFNFDDTCLNERTKYFVFIKIRLRLNEMKEVKHQINIFV